MELVKLLKGGNKTCHKHGYRKSNLFFLVVLLLVKVWARICNVPDGVLEWL